MGDAVNPNLKVEIDACLARCGVSVSECDLILDLGAPDGYELVEGLARLVEAMLTRPPYADRWRTPTLMGTSFPANMGVIKTSPAWVRRYEWILYKMIVGICTEKGFRVPSFGDYGISHPATVELDWRTVKPASKIRYTTDDAWVIVKGRNVRMHGLGQYRAHCETLVSLADYMGENFSSGDQYIARCADGTASTGNLTTWVKVGTNHHVARVVRDIATLFGFSYSP